MFLSYIVYIKLNNDRGKDNMNWVVMSGNADRSGDIWSGDKAFTFLLL